MIVEKGKTDGKLIGIIIAALAVLGVAVFMIIKMISGGGDASGDSLRVSIVDVGKGDCVLIQQGAHSMLIDTGYEETSNSVLKYFDSLGVQSLESIVVTHYDKDHVGGAMALASLAEKIYLPGYSVDNKYYKQLACSDAAGKLVQVNKDISFSLGDVNVEIYASDIEFDGSNDNDCSLVISIKYKSDSYLFAGDLEKEGIAAFLERHAAQWDVIKMPHHGNKKGNIDILLEAVSPKVAIITDSDSDPAADSVLKLLDAAAAKVYRTSKSGTIVITSSGDGAYKVE